MGVYKVSLPPEGKKSLWSGSRLNTKSSRAPKVDKIFCLSMSLKLKALIGKDCNPKK